MPSDEEQAAYLLIGMSRGMPPTNMLARNSTGTGVKIFFKPPAKRGYVLPSATDEKSTHKRKEPPAEESEAGPVKKQASSKNGGEQSRLRHDRPAKINNTLLPAAFRSEGYAQVSSPLPPCDHSGNTFSKSTPPLHDPPGTTTNLQEVLRGLLHSLHDDPPTPVLPASMSGSFAPGIVFKELKRKVEGMPYGTEDITPSLGVMSRENAETGAAQEQVDGSEMPADDVTIPPRRCAGYDPDE